MFCDRVPKCPACGYKFDDNDIQELDLITFHGDIPKNVECPNCEAKLRIDEFITRNYEVKLAKSTKGENR